MTSIGARKYVARSNAISVAAATSHFSVAISAITASISPMRTRRSPAPSRRRRLIPRAAGCATAGSSSTRNARSPECRSPSAADGGTVSGRRSATGSRIRSTGFMPALAWLRAPCSGPTNCSRSSVTRWMAPRIASSMGAQASPRPAGVRRRTRRPRRNRSSRVETSLASSRVSYMACVRLATKSLFAPEMAKNSHAALAAKNRSFVGPHFPQRKTCKPFPFHRWIPRKVKL